MRFNLSKPVAQIVFTLLTVAQPILAAEANLGPQEPSTQLDTNKFGSSTIDNSDLLHDVVLNGHVANQKSQSLKFTVRLELFDGNNNRTGSCTGVLIRKDIVITAGHCFKESTKKVKVQFGLGGKHGFTHEVMSSHFIWEKPYRPSHPKAQSPWKNGYLPFDKQSQESFESDIRERQGWFNYSRTNTVSFEAFKDIAVIRINAIAPGYSAIPLYSGKFAYGMPAYGFGYGTDSRVKTEITKALKWSKFNLVGHYTRQNENTIGWQLYSPTHQRICFGDSGGPLVIRVGKQFKLLGINLFVFNNCANSGWSLNVSYYISIINDYIKRVRSFTDA